ncbi:MAG: hypothetical protein V8R59_03910, partial [Enterocloster sp.]
LINIYFTTPEISIGEPLQITRSASFPVSRDTGPVSNIDVFGGVDGEDAQGIIRIHTSFHSHACVKGQIVQRGNRRIGNNGNMAASFCHDAGSGPAFI